MSLRDDNKDLAKALQELSSCPNLPAVPVLPGGAITPELEKAVREAIVKPFDPGEQQSNYIHANQYLFQSLPRT